MADEQAKPTKLTATDLNKAIAARYEPPEWHCESEVTLAGRRLDVVALNLWGARSYRIVGFEIKVTRGDWMRELDQFQKSEEWTAVVDQFYVVTPPKLIKDEELPVGWGLLELSGNRMMTRRHATLREGTRDTLPREVAARFLSRVGDAARNALRDAEWKAKHEMAQTIREEVLADAAKENADRRAAEKQVRDERDALLKALGVLPSDWRAFENAMRAAAVFTKYERDSVTIRQQLERVYQTLHGHTTAVRAAVDSLTPTIPIEVPS